MLVRFKKFISTDFGKKLTIITFVALGLRLIVVIFTANISASPNVMTDQASYIDAGQKLAISPFPYTNFSRPPLYPYLVASVIKMQNIAGLSDIPLRVSMGLLQAITGTTIVVLVALLVKKRISNRLAIITGWILAVWPNQVMNTSTIMTERLSTPLVVISITILWWRSKPSAFAVSISALVMSFAILTRPALWPMMILIIIYSIWQRKYSWSFVLLQIHIIGVAILPGLLILGAWINYSYEQNGEFLFIVNSNGYNLCLGNNPYATGRFLLEDGHQEYCEWGRNDKKQIKSSLNWIIHNPAKQPYLINNRFNALFDYDNDSLYMYPSYEFSELPGTPISDEVLSTIIVNWWFYLNALAALGLVMVIRYKIELYRWLLVMGLSAIFMPLITFGDSRFHDVFIPVIAVLAAEAWDLLSSFKLSKYKTNFPLIIPYKYSNPVNAR